MKYSVRNKSAKTSKSLRRRCKNSVNGCGCNKSNVLGILKMSGGCGVCGGMTGGKRKIGKRNIGKKQWGCDKKGCRKSKKNMKGGSFVIPPTIGNAGSYTYSQNNYMNDPQNFLSNARNDPIPTVGGGKRHTQRLRKMSGGSTGILDYFSTNVNDWILGNNTNPVGNFGTSAGTVFTNNLMVSNPILNNNPAIQPAGKMFSVGGPYV